MPGQSFEQESYVLSGRAQLIPVKLVSLLRTPPVQNLLGEAGLLKTDLLSFCKYKIQ